MIYLDNAATTKPSLNAIDKASIFLKEKYFNASALYQGGIDCKNQINEAKNYILRTLGAVNHQLIFTSCGSESDNLAIFGCVKKGVFLTDSGEHSAVYKSFLELKNKGNKVIFCELNRNGSVNIEKLLTYVKQEKVDFVSIVHVNNETGAINDVNFIAKKLKEMNPKVIFHVDGVQAYGKIPYKISKDIDFYAISAHKINGLKGTGALIRKKGVNLTPIIFGGGQEDGVRSGTENVYGIKVFQYASEEHYNRIKENFEIVSGFYNYFEENIIKDNIEIISQKGNCPYIFTFSVIGVRGEIIMHELEQYGIIVGNGSACSSKNRYSRVLEACGYRNEILDSVVRVSFSPYLELEDIKKAVEIINSTITTLRRKMSKWKKLLL